MLCPLKFSSTDELFCDKGKFAFYSGEKCAIASLSDIASEITELKSALNHTTETLEDTNKLLIMLAGTINCRAYMK